VIVKQQQLENVDLIQHQKQQDVEITKLHHVLKDVHQHHQHQFNHLDQVNVIVLHKQ
jgi:hypothetical protein